MKYIVLIVISLSSVNLTYSQAIVDFCYTIEQRSGNFYKVAQNGARYNRIGRITETDVEAIGWDRIGSLWMFDSSTAAFYTLDLSTVTTTLMHSDLSATRSDNGQIHQIKDVDALDFDAFDSRILHGVERIPGPNPDLYFQMDVTTGQIVGGVLYPVTGVGGDIDDIAINPLTNEVFAISNNDGMGDQLITIDPTNGIGTVIGDLVDAVGTSVNDMEGFSFDIDGQLIGITGEDSSIPGSFYSIDATTGIVTLRTTIDARCQDFESIACFNARVQENGMSVEVPSCDFFDSEGCPFVGPSFNINNSVCTVIGGVPTGGSIEVVGACPEGSTVQYRVDDGAWNEEKPTYNNETAEMLSIRCRCDEDNSEVSTPVTVSTSPGACPVITDPAMVFSSGDLSFGDPCSCEDPLNCTIGGVVYFHDILTISSSAAPSPPLASGTSIEILAGAMDFYTEVPCSGSGSLTLGTAGTVIQESSTSGVYEITFWRPANIVPSLSVSINGGSATEVPASTFEPVCNTCAPIPTVPTLPQWGLIVLGLMLMIFGAQFIAQTEEGKTENMTC